MWCRSMQFYNNLTRIANIIVAERSLIHTTASDSWSNYRYFDSSTLSLTPKSFDMHNCWFAKNKWSLRSTIHYVLLWIILWACRDPKIQIWSTEKGSSWSSHPWTRITVFLLFLPRSCPPPPMKQTGNGALLHPFGYELHKRHLNHQTSDGSHIN